MAPLNRPDYSTRLRASDPSDPTRTDVRPAGKVFLMALATLVLAALMNAGVLLEQTETAEFGTGRSLALRVWQPAASVGSALGLTRARDGMDALRDLDTTGDPAAKLIVAAGRPATDTQDGSSPPGTLGHGEVGGNDRGSADDPIADDPIDEPAGPTTSTRPADPLPDSGPSRVGSDSPASPAGAGSQPDGNDDADPAAAAPGNGVAPEGPTRPGPLLRRPSPQEPLRVLTIGDSTLDPVGAALLRDLTETGVAVGVVDYRVSTGLSRPDFFDWPAHLRELDAELGPEVVVIMMGANDAQAFAVGDQVLQFGSEEWIATYAARVEALVDQLTANGGWVIWVGQPAMRSGDFDTKMQVVNSIYAEVVDRSPNAVFVDSRPLTVDENGVYAAYLVAEDDTRFQARMTDGVHLTAAGGERLSPAIVDAIDAVAPLGG